MNVAGTDYRVVIPNKLWQSRGYRLVSSLSETIGRENYHIIYRKDEKGKVVLGKPVTIVFASHGYYVQFRLSIDLNKI